MNLQLIDSLTFIRKILLGLIYVFLIFIGCTLIIHGEAFDTFLAKENAESNFFTISNLTNAFNSQVTIPAVAKSIGTASILYLKVSFALWSVFFTCLIYLRLYFRMAIRIVFLIETSILLLVTFTFITTSSLFLFVLSLVLIAVDLALIILYWIYEIRTMK